jgi:hypothetical protein
MLRFKQPSSRFSCCSSSVFRFCSTSTTQKQQIELKTLFWSPINNRQLSENGISKSENFVKESPQKFQMIGHLEKISLRAPSSTAMNNNNDDNNNNNQKIFSWLGVQTNNPQVVEDFLIFLCTGFDIRKVDCENNFFLLEHSRNFLGWKPQPLNLTSSSNSEDEENKSIQNPNLIQLPFDMDFVVSTTTDAAVADGEQQQQLSTPKFSHVKFKSSLVETFQKTGNCPNEVLDCLDSSTNNNNNSSNNNREAVKMVVALRKAGVRPEIISWRALKSATKKTSSWASALGVM